ncbi:MAG: GvpL/GvpF family gas vesicle protein [Victivallales bacterium]|nr:GvpL/GvpF family gas vesicle protein [Victivallales bacterium]
MHKLGLYIYCIIPFGQERNFGPIGINGEDVLTIGYENIAMVVSRHPIAKIVISKDNMLTHEKVVEEVMKEFDCVLPVRYGTIASTADEVRNLLDRRFREFKNALRDMDHMVELNVKARWKNMDAVFKEIEKENEEIKAAKKTVNLDSNGNIDEARVKIGKMVEEALIRKKAERVEDIVDRLRRSCYDCKLNKTTGDDMIMNGAFLVGKGKELEFDFVMEDISDEFKDKINFKYSGPFPVYNFVNIAIYPEEWET